MLPKIEISGPAVAAFALCVVAGGIVSFLFTNPNLCAPFLVIGIYLLFSIRVVRQWEKVAVLRFGRFSRLQEIGRAHV